MDWPPTRCSTASPRAAASASGSPYPDGVLRAEVHDSGPGELRYGDMSPDSEHGRGLLLVTLLADKWGVGEREPGKVVWCEFAVYG